MKCFTTSVDDDTNLQLKMETINSSLLAHRNIKVRLQSYLIVINDNLCIHASFFFYFFSQDYCRPHCNANCKNKF